MIGILLALQLLGPVVGKASSASFALATTPAGASFTLYNVKGEIIKLGKTPFVGMLPAGRYRLVIQKPGFFLEQRGIVVQVGQQKIVQVKMFPQATKKPGKNSQGSKPVAGTTRVKPATRAMSRTKTRKKATTSPSPTPRNTKTPTPRNTKTPTTGPPPPPAANEIPPGKRGGQTPAPRQVRIGKDGSPANSKRADLAKKEKQPGKAKRKIPWIPLAAAAGLAIGGGIFWGLSESALTASKDRNKTQVEAYNEYQQARSHRSTAVFMLAGGGIALGLAGLFYFWPPSPKKGKGKGRYRNDDIPMIGFTVLPLP